jgi:hypothetical protein
MAVTTLQFLIIAIDHKVLPSRKDLEELAILLGFSEQLLVEGLES